LRTFWTAPLLAEGTSDQDVPFQRWIKVCWGLFPMYPTAQQFDVEVQVTPFSSLFLVVSTLAPGTIDHADPFQCWIKL